MEQIQGVDPFSLLLSSSTLRRVTPHDSLAAALPGLDQTATPYADALAAYADADMLRLDVPGHQASTHAQPGLADFLGVRTLELDVPPLTHGVDHGDVPTPLSQAAYLAAQAWGARRTWFLTNGASKGNLVACLALRGLGERVVLQRSVHSSVVDGLALAGLDAAFVYPSVDAEHGIAHGVTPDELDATLTAHPDVVAAYVVTPSYFGAVADVAELARVAHGHGVPLVVDEAWGSHFGFHPELPVNALRLGADLVISSTHKLAGSLTQSAMLHLGHGDFADRLEPLLDRAFRSMQSTSASALLMASLDHARKQLAVNGATTIGASLDAVAKIRGRIEAEGRFTTVDARMLAFDDVIAIDPLRVVIDTRSRRDQRTRGATPALRGPPHPPRDVDRLRAGRRRRCRRGSRRRPVDRRAARTAARRQRASAHDRAALARSPRDQRPGGDLHRHRDHPGRRRPSVGSRPTRSPPTRRGSPT